MIWYIDVGIIIFHQYLNLLVKIHQYNLVKLNLKKSTKCIRCTYVGHRWFYKIYPFQPMKDECYTDRIILFRYSYTPTLTRNRKRLRRLHHYNMLMRSMAIRKNPFSFCVYRCNRLVGTLAFQRPSFFLFFVHSSTSYLLRSTSMMSLYLTIIVSANLTAFRSVSRKKILI